MTTAPSADEASASPPDLLQQALLLRDQRRPAEALALLKCLPWPPTESRAWLLRGSVEHLSLIHI
jgi:hypothetical protein